MRKINKVLLVDDDLASNFLNKSVIEKIDFANEIVLKNNGKEAFDYLEKECQSENFPDLILLDLKMPVMDGFEFLKEFERLCYNLKDNIVVVILASSNNADDYVKLMHMGNYYAVVKPLTIDKLFDIHHRYFRNLNSN